MGQISDIKEYKDDEKLIKIDSGNGTSRIILQNLNVMTPSIEEMVGKKIIYIANMIPRQFKSKKKKKEESNGMILYAQSK